MWIYSWVLGVLLLNRCHTSEQDRRNVTTSCGDVTGARVKTAVGAVYEYRNIPYAVPPVGDLRWKHSTPLDESGNCWKDRDEILDGTTSELVRCPWYGSHTKDTPEEQGREDCLVLSVRAPELAESLPVLVWIHGGGLYYGYGDEAGYYPDPNFTADLNLVTVTLNYRLFAGGFMSRPEVWSDKENYGNFGIGDALQALRWVKKNIAAFGGDPSKVTLLGESSGATVALGLAISPLAYDLFNNVISLSSAPVWKATYETSYENRKSFADDLGCTQTDASERLDCMKAADFLDLTKAWDNNRGWAFYKFPLSMGELQENLEYNVIGDQLIPFAPKDVAEKGGERNKIKLILSNTAQENGYDYFIYPSNTTRVGSWEKAETMLIMNLEKFFGALNHVPDIHQVKEVVSKIKQEYGFERRHNWPQLFWDTITTDLRSTCPTNDLADAMKEADNYEILRLYIRQRPFEELCTIPYDTFHGWDTEALFDYGYYGLKSSKLRQQRQFRDTMRDIVSNIARDMDILKWSSENDPTLVVGNDELEPLQTHEDHPQKKKCAFWRELGEDYGVDFLAHGWEN